MLVALAMILAPVLRAPAPIEALPRPIYAGCPKTKVYVRRPIGRATSPLA